MARRTRPGDRPGSSAAPARRRPRTGQAGFTYLGVLFLVVLLSLGLAGASQLWSVLNQRDRELELLWVGTQYAKALRSYRQRSPGGAQYPQQLADLVEDKRFPVPLHHLRQLYRDPVGRTADWGLVKTPDGRIAGVYSQAPGQPLKRANFPPQWNEFADWDTYSAWRFVADDALRTPPKSLAGRQPSADTPKDPNATPGPLPDSGLSAPSNQR